MNHKFNIELTKEYFLESFEQSVKYGSKWRKIEYMISIFLIIFGVYLYFYAKGETFLPILLIALGLFELFSPYLKKIIWIKRQMSNKLANTNVEMVVTEQALLTKGKYSEGCMAWEGMERMLETPKGILLWPQKGIKIYIPKSKLPLDIINYISSKFD